ncbi:hypothetical protein FUA23_14340 [Neolewinella aurantiaca]|uniref:ATP-grasp domain-containing protein n=1 Tax=Neolewinella aurantiaca TaxID=2602767 RepID=A0A5C7FSS3_9BACT|nr:hypothetical protein [Neolewinella aurantiaca]TXF88461.1 hypothetical protein FUA23_14340 [Neolewinella aurantiaca]
MILVLTYRKYEQGTDPVIDWLIRYDAPFVRLDLLSLLEGRNRLHFEDDGRIIIDGYDLQDQIKVVFYRRFLRSLPLDNCQELPHHLPQLRSDLNREAADVFREIFRRLSHAHWLPDFEASERADNKLHMTKLARAAGLRVPSTLVCNRKDTLLDFYRKKPGGLICKPINFCGYYFRDGFAFTAYTKMVDEDFLKATPDRFFPTLFQEVVERDFELRIFYLDGKFFPTAIYSNDYGENLADVKLIAEEDTTHNLPFALPEELKERLDAFMKSAGLTTGSIDVLKDMDGRHQFIEVNPVGQYLAPGRKCNYFIEKKIAEWLIQKNREASGLRSLSPQNLTVTSPSITAT